MFALLLLLQTTTTCTTFGATTTCDTMPDPNRQSQQDGEQLRRGLQDLNDTLAKRRASKRAAAEAAAAQQAADNDAAYKRWIGGRIAAGQCIEARTDALQKARYDMVEVVDRFCHLAAPAEPRLRP